MRHFLDKKTLMLLYFAYIDSALIYCSPIWGAGPQKYLDKIQVLQNRAKKYIENKKHLTPTVELYSEDFLSFNQKCVYEAIFFMFKIKNKLIKTTYSITDNFEISNTNTRNKNKIRLPRYSMALAQKSIFYRGAKLLTKFLQPYPK